MRWYAVLVIGLWAACAMAQPGTPAVCLVWEAEAAQGLPALTPEQAATWKGFRLAKHMVDPAGKVSGEAGGPNVLAIRNVSDDEDGPAVEGGPVTYTVNVPKQGTYYLWARCFWVTAHPTVGIRLPGSTANRVLGGDGTYAAMHWVRLRDNASDAEGPMPIALEAGPNVIALVPREPGVKIDQFLLTTDPAFRPAGIYPPTPAILVE